MKNEKLAIVIPTYNRAEILKENLLYMMDDIKEYNIPVYISDDSSNNDTKIVISELKNDYEYIYYYKNEPSLGHDKNCFKTLGLASEKYIWYLGDSVYVHKGEISNIMASLVHECDLFVVNTTSKSRTKVPESKVYFEANDVLVNLAWHMTFTGATIYSLHALKSITLENDTYYKNFPQLVLSLHILALNSNGLYWTNKKILSVNKLKETSYWNTKVFDVFAFDWCQTILNLPKQYTEKNKLLAIKSHSKYTNIFNWKRLVYYRSENIYSYSIYKKYYSYLKKSSQENIFVLILISLMPSIVAKIIIRFYRLIKGKN